MKQEVLEFYRNYNPKHEGRPVHAHDCDNCIFLGHGHNYDTGEDHDLYYCPRADGGTLIDRYGPMGEYSSGFTFADSNPMLALAYLRAQMAGLLDEPMQERFNKSLTLKFPKRVK